MVITTGYGIDGYTIIEYKDIVSAAVVLGTGFFSSLSASFADLTGERSGAYENKLNYSKNQAIRSLKNQAEKLGGNAIIGIDIDYTTFGSDIMGVIASGTVVVTEKIVQVNGLIEYTIPSFSYTENLPFNIYDIKAEYNSSNDNVKSCLELKIYKPGYHISAIMADLELENIFKQKFLLSDIIFKFEEINNEDGWLTSEQAKLNLEDYRIDLIEKSWVIINKIVINGMIYDIDSNSTIKVSDLSLDEMNKLRKINGKDAIRKPQILENKWGCCCGAFNDKQELLECKRCGRKINPKQKQTILLNEINSQEAKLNLDLIENLKSAKEIFEYIGNCIDDKNTGYLDLAEQLEKIVGMERLYGNMRAEAINKVEEYLRGQ